MDFYSVIWKRKCKYIRRPPCNFNRELSLNLERKTKGSPIKRHLSPRTLEKWEQGRTKPKEQAATLIMLVLFHTLEKAHHHSRKVIISGVVMRKF
jgi:hypothetical protein